MRSKLIYTIFAIVVLIAGVLIAISLAPPVANSGGLPHPDIAGMQVGGDGAARLEYIGFLAFAFQCLLLGLVVCLCALGVSERRRTREFMIYMGSSLGLMLIVWWQMVSAHQEFLESGSTAYFMGFPIATAWQVYGTWLGAIPLILIYSIGFRKYIYTREDEEKFNSLLAERKVAEQNLTEDKASESP